MNRRETKPIWTTSTFLVYTGGLTVLGGGLGALAYLSTQFRGHGQEAAWALLIYIVLMTIAYGLRRLDRPVAAGIFAFVSVNAWAALVILAFEWWGWNVNASTRKWSWAALAAQLLILLAAWDARRRFRFPFIRLVSGLVGWVFVLQLLPAGGNWTATWTFLVGLAYLAWGTIHRTPSSFWLHLLGGGLIGGAILYWAHTGDGDFAVISIVSMLYVLIAYWTKRSSWAFWGTIGFFVATVHYLVGSPTGIGESVLGGQTPHLSTWSFPLAFGILGFFLVVLGMLGRRRHGSTIVVEPAPAAE